MGYESDFQDRIGERKVDQLPGPFNAEVVNTPTALGQDVFVKIPAIDNGTMKWGPVRWDARSDNSLPHAGVECAVVIDNNREVWMIGWWPYA